MSFKKFVGGRLKAITYAGNGLRLLLTEHSIIAQLFLMFLVTLAGIYYGITKTEWMIQILVCACVLTAEGLNTALEALADFVHPDFDKRIGMVKDIAAGAVFIIAIASIIIGLMIYIPYIFP